MFASLGGLFGLIVIALWLWALYDSITTPAEQVRLMPKGIWVILILILLPVADLGAIAWFVLGRPRSLVRTPTDRAKQTSSWSTPRPAPRRFIAPDDDPEFLRGLNKPKPEDGPRS